MKKYDVIVIGAGLAGIAVALRLRKQNKSVLVLERTDTFGGKLKEFSWGEYRWDRGPSLFTLPEQVTELFSLYGLDPEAFFTFQKIEESSNYFFPDGTEVLITDAPETRNKNLQKAFGTAQGQAAIDYIKETEKTYKAIGDLFIDKPKYGFKNILNKDLIKRYPLLMSKKVMGSLNAFNHQKFKDPNLVQLFNRYGTYNGSNPYKMSGLYSMIGHLEFNDGTFFPKNGMRSIVETLFNLAVENGIEFKFNQHNIRAFKVENSAYEIIAQGETYHTSKLISAIECSTFYKNILQNDSLADKYAKQERSSSALVFYWAVETIIPTLKLHNTFFSSDYQQEFKEIFEEKIIPNNPTIYLHVSSVVNPQDAPLNGQNWFVMMNTPAGVVPTSKDIERLEKYIIQQVYQKFKIDITNAIKHKDRWDAQRIEEASGAYLGSLYGASSNHKLAALFRHGNESKQYKNVYFCGGTVHPGGGIPLVLKSAKIVSQIIANEK